MRRFLIGVALVWALSSGSIKAEYAFDRTDSLTDSLMTELNAFKATQAQLNNQIRKLSRRVESAESRIVELQSSDHHLELKVDSLQVAHQELMETQRSDKGQIEHSLGQTNEKLQTTEKTVSSRTLWGGIAIAVLVLGIGGIALAFSRKFRTGAKSIDSVRKVQEALQAEQQKLQEESIKLDNQLLTIAQQQLEASQAPTSEGGASGEPDHSLVVKLADEIARIETNLSKMDSSVRGYKQLVQAKDRMINNVRANGYEIISLLGQEYNDGMQFQTRFVPDESLPEGKRIITGMIKMQVNYNGKMIQPAEIVVSQNI